MRGGWVCLEGDGWTQLLGRLGKLMGKVRVCWSLAGDWSLVLVTVVLVQKMEIGGLGLLLRECCSVRFKIGGGYECVRLDSSDF